MAAEGPPHRLGARPCGGGGGGGARSKNTNFITPYIKLFIIY
jgi:hypothetical protein